jgi:hypothetical protein
MAARERVTEHWAGCTHNFPFEGGRLWLEAVPALCSTLTTLFYDAQANNS